MGVIVLLSTVILSACSTDSQESSTATEIGVPADAAGAENPIEASAQSIAAGEDIYASSCALCHGESGAGDGVGAMGLNPAPADLNQRVPERTEGELFWIITNGSPGTAMPPWEAQFDEAERWNVVDYLQATFE